MNMTFGRRAVAGLSLIAVLSGTGAVAASSAQAAESADKCYITAKAANIRSLPSAKSTAVGVAYKGWTCKYVEGKQGWVKAKFPRSGVTGWVNEDLIYITTTPICLPESVC